MKQKIRRAGWLVISLVIPFSEAGALETRFKGTIDAAWNKPANWSNGVPVAGDTFVLPDQPSPFPFPIPVIIDGYAASAANGFVGEQPLEFGTLQIHNGGSLTVSNSLFVGWKANAGLVITGGGSLTAGFLDLGRGATATLTVTDSGSLLNIASASVGRTSTLTVSNGARVQCNSLAVDNSVSVQGIPGSRGVLSAWQIKAGDYSAGTVTIDGGVIQARIDQLEYFSLDYGTSSVVLASGGGYFDTAGYAVGTEEVLSGNGALHKIGNGTLTLAGENTYSGGTVVTQGTLVVSGNSGAGSGTVQVGVNGRLAGTGTIAGNTSVAGQLAPGNSIGQINVTSFTGDPSLDFASSAVTQIEIGSLGYFDRVVVDGSIFYDGTLQIDFLNSYLPNVGDTFQIFTVGTASTGAFDQILFSNPNYAASFNASNGILQITVIPEPSAASLLVVSCAAILLRRMRNTG